MRVLLDEHLPVRLVGALSEHQVSTVRGEGWSGTKNGALLDLAAAAAFSVLLTSDRSIEFQQNISKVAIGIVVLDAPTNKYEDLLPLMPAAVEAISSVKPGEVRHVAAGSR